MSHKYDLVSVDHEGTTLHGLVHRASSSRGVVLHVHGTWGNFYGNPFVAPLTEAYASRGFSFATLNFPGHDETAIYEQIEDFPSALRAWMQRLDVSGPVILQGHSLGAVKAAFLLGTVAPAGDIGGAVFLAPFDVVAFYSRSGTAPGEVLGRISDLDDRDLVPGSVFDIWPISAGTLRAALTEGGPWDQFPTRRGDPGKFLLSGALPVLVQVGLDDFAATPSPGQVVQTMAQAPNTHVQSVKGAPHNFAGCEAAVSAHVSKWLDDHFA